MLGITTGEIRKKVTGLKKKYGTSDPFELCSCLETALLGVNFGTSETAIKAMTMTSSRMSCIQYNICLPEILLRFIVAHELGHAVLHKNKYHMDTGFFDDVSLTEREANLFAAELLLGDSEKVYNEMRSGDLTMFQYAAEHKVPYELLAYKLEIMSDEGYDIPDLPYEPDSRFLGRDLFAGDRELCRYGG